MVSKQAIVALCTISYFLTWLHTIGKRRTNQSQSGPVRQRQNNRYKRREKENTKPVSLEKNSVVIA